MLPINRNDAIIVASRENQLEAMEIITDLGANCFNHALSTASREGHLEGMKLLRELGAFDYNWALISATIGNWCWPLVNETIGNYTTPIEMANWGGINFDESSTTQLESMKLLKEWGADCFNHALDAAIRYERESAIELLLSWGAIINGYYDEDM